MKPRWKAQVECECAVSGALPSRRQSTNRRSRTFVGRCEEAVPVGSPSRQFRRKKTPHSAYSAPGSVYE
jgi:hypothetical protein